MNLYISTVFKDSAVPTDVIFFSDSPLKLVDNNTSYRDAAEV